MTTLNPLFNIAPLLSALERNELILTPNQRLSRKIREAWSAHNIVQGNSHWPPANVMPLESWQHEIWLQLVDNAFAPALAGVPISGHQARYLWETVISQNSDHQPFMQPHTMAPLVAKTWPLVRQWQLDTNTLSRSQHQGAVCLCQWGLAWEAELSQRQLISSEQQAIVVAQGFSEGTLQRLTTITLVGFQSLTPLQHKVLNTACETLIQAEQAGHNRALQQWSAADIDREIATAAAWAKDLTTKNPTERIGIVVPDLAALRKKVARLFLNRFAPGHGLPGSSYQPTPFNISAATPLSELPVVMAALNLLALNRTTLDYQHLVNLLNNPYWGHYSREGEERNHAIKTLLDTRLANITTGIVRELLFSGQARPNNREPDNGQTALADRLLTFASEQRQHPRKNTFQQWRSFFDHQLQLLGWPGQHTLDSHEYQQREHWAQLLDQFEQLDSVAPPCTVQEALAQLLQLARATSFQPEVPDAQVQILGTLEAAGLRFDHLWIMQMDDLHWPASTRPNPLLPPALQRQLQMPRACPQRELALGKALFKLLCDNGGNVVASFARQDGDIHLQPSALLTDIPHTSMAETSALHPFSSEVINSSELEIIEDKNGPPLARTLTNLPSGAGFIAAQAGCPFNAFARYRLGAEPLPQPVTGLTPMERGNLLHSSLDIFWRTCKSQATLLQLSSDQRQQQLQDAIAASFRQFQRQAGVRAKRLGVRYLHLEQTRLLGLLQEWLELEAARTPFSIADTELATTASINGIDIKLRIDRIDRLDNGCHVIVDYKTGSANARNLGNERMAEPQLPLYALAIGEPLSTIGYGVIQGKQVHFSGVSCGDKAIEGSLDTTAIGLPEKWDSTLDLWHNQLINIVNEIQACDCEVAFYHRQARQFGTHLEPLNRYGDRDRIPLLNGDNRRCPT